MKLSYAWLALAAIETITASPICPAPNNNILQPSTTSLYFTTPGTTESNVKYGLVRNIIPNKSDITTLVTFTVPDDWAGKQCTLSFDTNIVSSSRRTIDVFSTLKPIAKLNYGNHRDQYVGRFVVRDRGIDHWDIVTDKGPVFSCPTGQVVGFEFVGVYNTGELRWSVGAGLGPRIELSR